ncbi:diguanylate cyclase phosphodiesterase domain-containing protein [Companilactobacillus mindensis DSM 14500]|uniref:Diguanylate cyclase phosphodiesterase domain-containing protein n=1 Tax=Companilactobacillus mindensis DSM 14500 TaxID=1423770 RepID=A0A0R1QFR6_9LACO|nr:EAL domain-containing protein [Companilactobacillus mindensis]KRL43393.1 diguanylate cyclase phosphodiesterase domain-containing protein [Companilactobacillus mindensis DSM 14500]GEO78857.1 diguanylate cyclase [Companilactobacillus mindensis]
MKYSFFAQPQINKCDDSIFGYEVLLRKEDNGAWHLPQDFTELSIADQVKLVEKTAMSLNQHFGKKQVISFNLNQSQASDPLTLGEIIALKKRISPISLMIELTEAMSLKDIKCFSLLLHQYDISLVIDDVGTGSNTFKNVRDLLPYVDRIKFAMQNLRMDGEADKIPECLSFWVEQAKKYSLDMVLEGVEDAKDQILAKKFGINIQQGYLYGKPAHV